MALLKSIDKNWLFIGYCSSIPWWFAFVAVLAGNIYAGIALATLLVIMGARHKRKIDQQDGIVRFWLVSENV